MGSMLHVIWQLMSLCTIAAVLAVPGSSGSILQSPAASSSVKSPLLDQSIKGSLPFLSPGQSTTPSSEHGSRSAVPAQPLQTVPITTETPHVSTVPPAAEPPLVLSQRPAAHSSNDSSLKSASDASSALTPQLAMKPPGALQPPAPYSSNDSSPTPASDASPASTPRLAMKAPGALAPLSNAHSLPLSPLMAQPPLEGPPYFPSPVLPDAQPHTSASPLAAMPSNPLALLPLAEPPQAVSVPPSEAQPFLPAPSAATTMQSPPCAAATMQSPVSPNGSPPLPQQVPSHTFPLPLPREAPSIITSPLPEVPPHASVMPLPPFLSNASSPLPQQVPSHASAMPLLQEAPQSLPSPLPAVLPHASVIPSPPFPPNVSSRQPQQVPSHASAVPPSQEASPIKPSPLPAVLPYAPVMLPPPFLSNASSPLPQEIPSHASLPPLPQEALPITPSPLPAVPPHASVMSSPPFPANASSPLPQQVPSHASSLLSPQEAPLIKSSPLPAVPPHASVTPLPHSNASSPLSQLAPSGSSPPNFIVPSHAFVPPPLMVPLPQGPPPSFPSLFPPMPPYASALRPPPGPPNASSPQPQLVPSHPVPPRFITPPVALLPPPLMEPLPIEPPAISPSPTRAIPPAASAIPLPPISPHASSPPLQLVPSQASPPYFKGPSHALALPPLMMPLPKEPPSILPSSTPSMPPSASTMLSPLATHKSSPFSHPAAPQASPRTFLVPPHLIRPPHAFSMSPPPIELPDNFPPPSSTLPGAMPPHAFTPPTMSPPFAPAPLVVPSLPSEKSYSYAPPAPRMQESVPVIAPHTSQRKEKQNGVPPSVPASPEPLPSSLMPPKGAPSVHEVMPRSRPPFYHQTEIPSGSSFRRSNASVPHLPTLSGPAPSNNTFSSGVPLAAPPGNNAISSAAPLTAPPGSITGIAPPPFSSQVHPPSVRFHYSPHHCPLEGPSNLALMPAALSPKSSTSEGSCSSAVSPSLSIHKYPREGARSPAPASVLVPPPTPSQQGQVESPSPLYAPKPSPAGGQKCNPSSPLSQGSTVAAVPSSSPSRVPELSPVPSKIPFLSPKISPSGSSTRNTKRPLAPRVRALPPPPPNQDCASLTCQEPYTNSPPGSRCGCVWPMQVGLRLSVALYTFFPLVSELAREIAAGVLMNQSQVRIMGADAAGQEPEKTIVLIDLVPLNDKFDYATAMSTSQRFWHKKVAIDKSIFGDYDVLYVRYPGLPPSPPMAPDDAAVVNSMPYSVGDPNGSKLHPLGVDIPKQRYQHKLSGSLIAIIVFSAIVVVLICGLGAWVLISRYTNDDSQSAQIPPAVSSLARLSGPIGHSHGSGPISPLSFGSSLAAHTGSARTFSASEIEKATGNFNPSGILGEGGFGCVYRGILEDGTSVAVKVLKREDQQGGREFLAEVEMLSRLHHRNLVKLIGICVDERMRCLVYELVPNGSVDSHLHGVDKEAAPLDWASRLKVALGAARGLAYLHEDSSPRVIHRDFKSSNILLENDFTPKVSDFGLARAALDEENRHISTRVMGTFGYVAPEYAMTGHLLVKSDVYSYGVVLLELLTGRKPVDMSQPPGQENLVAWARPLLTNKEGLESVIDPSLGPNVPFESVAKVAAIASMCVQPEVSHRPFMGEVVQALKLVCNECSDSKDGEDSRSLSHENLLIDFDADVGTSLRETPDTLPVQLSSHGFPPRHDLEKGLSVSEIFSLSARADMQTLGSFRRHSASGPMRTSKGPKFWQKIRRMSQGNVSEHGIMCRSWAGSQ